MSEVDTPHFDLPFRLGPNGVAVVEQDSIEDVTNSVILCVMTPVGWRDEAPSFGITDPALQRQPIGVDELTHEISDQEPRALLLIEEQPDVVDEMVVQVNLGVGTLRAT